MVMSYINLISTRSAFKNKTDFIQLFLKKIVTQILKGRKSTHYYFSIVTDANL